MILWSDAPQGSDAWLAVRRGAVTGSRAADARMRTDGLTTQQRTYIKAVQQGLTDAQALAVAGYKKAPTSELVALALSGATLPMIWQETALTYAHDLARERVGGEVMATFTGGAATRKGHAEEEPARCDYEQRTGNLVETRGFAFTEDGFFGCSVDGLVHLPRPQPAPIVWECKTVVSSNTLWRCVIEGDTSQFRDQCLFNMWLLSAGATHLWLHVWDIPELSQLVVIERDEDEIQALEDDMVAFNELVESCAATLRARMAPAPTAPAVPTSRPAVIKTPAQPVALPNSLFA